MANHAQAKKRNRQRLKRQALARHYRSTMRTFIKRVRAAIGASEAEEAQQALRQAVPVITRCAQKGMIPRQRASRVVSRLTRAVQSL